MDPSTRQQSDASKRQLAQSFHKSRQLSILAESGETKSVDLNLSPHLNPLPSGDLCNTPCHPDHFDQLSTGLVEGSGEERAARCMTPTEIAATWTPPADRIAAFAAMTRVLQRSRGG